mgnify:CR=1 FL=1
MNKIITLGTEKNEFIVKPEAMDMIVDIEKKIKELKNKQDDYKKILLNEMEEMGIFKIENEQKGITISYIEAKDNLEKFNQLRFREDHPDLYDEYVTLDGKKSAYITIKTK